MRRVIIFLIFTFYGVISYGQTCTVPGWVIPPVSPPPGVLLCWWPVIGTPVLSDGADPVDNSMTGSGGTNVTMTVGHTAAGLTLPSANWAAVLTPPVYTLGITNIYLFIRGDFNGILGPPSFILPATIGPIDIFVSNSTWSGPHNQLISPTSSYPNPTIFPWGNTASEFTSSSSLFDTQSPPGVSNLTDAGFLIYYTPSPNLNNWSDVF